MNSITVAGQLGLDSELKALSNGDPVLSFSVADNQGREKPTIWWRCSLFGKRAESLQQYLLKGQAVTVTGNITEREYTDKEGNKRKAQEIRVVDIALQGGAKPQTEQPAKRPSHDAAKARQLPKASSGFEGMDDDIPW